MKKLLFLLALLPCLAFGERNDSYVNNEYVLSYSTTVATNAAWHVYNSSANTKTIYIKRIDMGSQSAGEFTVISSAPSNGVSYTGTSMSLTPSAALLSVVITSSTVVGANPLITTTGSASIAAAKACGSATVAGGNQLWAGIIAASSTVTLDFYDSYIALKPGTALYVRKAQAAANAITNVSLRWKEDYR